MFPVNRWPPPSTFFPIGHSAIALNTDPVPRWIAVPGAALPELPALGQGEDEVFFAVGPEGGFTGEEVEAAARSGWTACGFPTPVLRTPTAVALIAALGLLWGAP